MKNQPGTMKTHENQTNRTFLLYIDDQVLVRSDDYYYYSDSYYYYHHGQVPVRSDEAMDLVERAPGSQSDTVVDTEKMPESRVSIDKLENV